MNQQRRQSISRYVGFLTLLLIFGNVIAWGRGYGHTACWMLALGMFGCGRTFQQWVRTGSILE